MDRGAWWATVHGVAKSWTQLKDLTHTATNRNSFTSFQTRIPILLHLCNTVLEIPASAIKGKMEIKGLRQ